ncbi:MAG: hypothetical protein RID09_13810 [Coleofasciculus sp. G1-WW12-02]
MLNHTTQAELKTPVGMRSRRRSCTILLIVFRDRRLVLTMPIIYHLQ